MADAGAGTGLAFALRVGLARAVAWRVFRSVGARMVSQGRIVLYALETSMLVFVRRLAIRLWTAIGMDDARAGTESACASQATQERIAPSKLILQHVEMGKSWMQKIAMMET